MKTTFRLWRPLDAQFDAFVGFLLSNESSPPSPFPLLVTDDNFRRHDPWDAIALHHIFRDPWERKVTPTKPPERDVRSTGDYPELIAMWEEIEKVYQVDGAEQFEGRYSPTQDILVDLGILSLPAAEPDVAWDTEAGNPRSDVSSLLPAMTSASTDEQDWGKAEEQFLPESREQPCTSEGFLPPRAADVSMDDQKRNEAESWPALETREQPSSAEGISLDRTADISKDAPGQTQEQEQFPAEGCNKPDDSEGAPPARAEDDVVGKGKIEERF